jgi:hypothetical protein
VSEWDDNEARTFRQGFALGFGLTCGIAAGTFLLVLVLWACRGLL